MELNEKLVMLAYVDDIVVMRETREQVVQTTTNLFETYKEYKYVL